MPGAGQPRSAGPGAPQAAARGLGPAPGPVAAAAAAGGGCGGAPRVRSAAPGWGRRKLQGQIGLEAGPELGTGLGSPKQRDGETPAGVAMRRSRVVLFPSQR